MATVNYSVKYKTNPACIYVRFVNGRALSIAPRTTGLVINPEYWDSKKQKVRDVAAVTNRVEINSNLTKLKSFLIDAFNSSYMKGDLINGLWVDQKRK